MKELEKWRNKQKISGRSYKADARVWRAALEMVILIHDESYDNPEKGIYVGDIIRDKLEEELKDENIRDKDQWCEACRKKIENAKDLDVIPICKACAKRNLK